MPRKTYEEPHRAADIVGLIRLQGKLIGTEHFHQLYVMDGKVWWVPYKSTDFTEVDENGVFHSQDYFEFCDDVRAGHHWWLMPINFHLKDTNR